MSLRALRPSWPGGAQGLALDSTYIKAHRSEKLV
jgi:hypothetical protein